MDEVLSSPGRVVTFAYRPDRTSEELLAKAYRALNGQKVDGLAGRDSVQADLEEGDLASFVEEAGR